MKRLQFNPSQYTQPKSKANSDWELMAEEIAERFQVPQRKFRFLFWRVDKEKIRQAMKSAGTIDELIRYALSK